jgi:cytochrome c oxidase cbb3-type subunit 2
MLENHSKLEKNLFLLLVFMVIVASIGTIIEIFPLFIKEISIEKVDGMRPHTPLELAGMEIYKREGCYTCHSQQIRALRDEVERYGHYSLAAESMYDYPFLWGSKRTGPDLARVGGKYSDDWHAQHLIAPRSLVPESIMPNYKFLAHDLLDLSDMHDRLVILKLLGVPYSEEDIEKFEEDIKIQLGLITDQEKIDSFLKRYPKAFIRKFYEKSGDVTEMDAMVGYLQALGNKVDLKTNRGRDW